MRLLETTPTSNSRIMSGNINRVVSRFVVGGSRMPNGSRLALSSILTNTYSSLYPFNSIDLIISIIPIIPNDI